MIYGLKMNSLPQKLLIMFLQTLIVILAYWILFMNGFTFINKYFHTALYYGDYSRRVLIMIFIIIIYLRMTLTILYLLKRSVGWSEALTIPFAFMIYYIGFSLLGGSVHKQFGLLELAAVAVFLSGSFINTYSEILRDMWKKKPGNYGKLYTEGLFKHSRHINYLGDIIWVSGFAILTHNICSAIIPAMLFCFFRFYNAPLLDKHLEKKYGKEFIAYKCRATMLFPYWF